MAADYTGNPVRMDTNADAVSGIWVQQIVWANVDGATRIAAEDRLVLVVNGTTIEFSCDDPTTGVGGVVASVGPFAHPVYVDTLTVTLIEGGQLQVWLKSSPPESITP